MSFITKGITHCKKCGQKLKINEWNLCLSCKNKEELDKAINNIIKEKMQNFIIVENGKEREVQGYWRDNKFIII